MKRPAFQFYPGDWLRDTPLQSCSIGARGLWAQMLCVMHDGTPYGHLSLNGKPLADASAAQLLKVTPAVYRRLLAELEAAGVPSRNADGVIYSRRMVKDDGLRITRAECGAQGGNPKLTVAYNRPGSLYAVKRASDGAIKIGIAQNPVGRLYKLRQQHKPDELDLLSSIEVPDMGVAEAAAHAKFASKRVNGEWFRLSPEDLSAFGFPLRVNQSVLKGEPKGSTKEDSTPAFAVASASISEEGFCSSTAAARASEPAKATTTAPNEKYGENQRQTDEQPRALIAAVNALGPWKSDDALLEKAGRILGLPAHPGEKRDPYIVRLTIEVARLHQVIRNRIEDRGIEPPPKVAAPVADIASKFTAATPRAAMTPPEEEQRRQIMLRQAAD